MRTEPFEFDSNGEALIATLYLPARRAVATVVTTGPLTSVKEQAGRHICQGNGRAWLRRIGLRPPLLR
jgi:hypothetical protein